MENQERITDCRIILTDNNNNFYGLISLKTTYNLQYINNLVISEFRKRINNGKEFSVAVSIMCENLNKDINIKDFNFYYNNTILINLDIN